MISRNWKGIARPGQADAYVRHLQHATFPALAALPGFVRASILRREVEGGTEFLIVTQWQSVDAIRAFAGADPEEAVLPAVARAMMLDYDRRAVHYEVAGTYPPG
jgi:heme-degrading monooxygenase HmoA